MFIDSLLSKLVIVYDRKVSKKEQNPQTFTPIIFRRFILPFHFLCLLLQWNKTISNYE